MRRYLLNPLDQFCTWGVGSFQLFVLHSLIQTFECLVPGFCQLSNRDKETKNKSSQRAGCVQHSNTLLSHRATNFTLMKKLHKSLKVQQEKLVTVCVLSAFSPADIAQGTFFYVSHVSQLNVVSIRELLLTRWQVTGKVWWKEPTFKNATRL